MKVKRISFAELSRRLNKLELKHGYSTIEFFQRFKSGKLGHDDEYMTWAGLYHLYLTSLPVRQFMRTDALSA